MGFAVLHIEKGSSGKADGLQNHIERLKHVPNADQARGYLNVSVDLERSTLHELHLTQKKPTMRLQQRVNNRIKEGYTGKTALRKDAVTHLTVVLTGSHEPMKSLEADPQKFNQWLADNWIFACEKYGQANIVSFAVHRDERTPHIHCVVVPLTSDGRLSAKKVMGDREQMSNLQEQYAQAMEQYGLERGVKGSTATHDSVQEFYARVNSIAIDKEVEQNIEAAVEKAIQETQVKLPRFIWNPGKLAEKTKDEIINILKNTILPYIKKLKTQLAKQANELMRLRKENAQLKGKIEQQDRELHPEKYPQKKPILFTEQELKMELKKAGVSKIDIEHMSAVKRNNARNGKSIEITADRKDYLFALIRNQDNSVKHEKQPLGQQHRQKTLGI